MKLNGFYLLYCTLIQIVFGYKYSGFVKGPGCNSLESIRYPKSIDEVVAIVKEALSRGVPVKAFGSRHSSTDIICTEGIPIDMHGIDGMSLDKDHVLTVGSGVTVGDMTEYLMRHGRGLPIIPAFQNITVGGAIGTGAHGSSLKYTASLSDQVVELLIVDGYGNFRQIQSEADLRSFRVHLGLLGIILEVKLRTIPLYKFHAHNYVCNEKILTNGDAIKMAENTDQIIFFWFPSFRKVVVANWTRVDVSWSGNSHTNALIPPTTASFNFIGKRILEFAQSTSNIQLMNFLQYISYLALIQTVPDTLPFYTNNDIHSVNPAVGYYHRMSSVSCREDGWVQCPWAHGDRGAASLDNEMAIDVHDIPKFVQRAMDILNKYPAVLPLAGFLIRFSGASTTHMSLSHGRNTAHIEFYPLDRENKYKDPKLGLPAYQLLMQSLLHEFDGRSHWGKSGYFYHSRINILRKLDGPARDAFIHSMKVYDPQGVFLNDFARRLLGLSEKINTDPHVVFCALRDDCVCVKKDDCGMSAKCGWIKGYPNYPVCLPIQPSIHTKLIDFSKFTFIKQKVLD